MINIIRTSILLSLIIASLAISGCESPERNQLNMGGDDRPNDLGQMLIGDNVITPSPAWYRGDHTVSGRILVIRVDPKAPDGRGGSVILFDKFGEPGNVLLMICTDYNLKQDHSYAIIGTLSQDSQCPGLAFNGDILIPLDECRGGANKNQVFHTNKETKVIGGCEQYSFLNKNSDLVGNCEIDDLSKAFDTHGLSECKKLGAAWREEHNRGAD